MYRFYKQKSAGKDVVYLLLEEGIPDEVISYEDVTLLYNNKRLIGANFFGKETALLSSYGMAPSISEAALAGFNAVLGKHDVVPLPTLSDSGFLVGEIVHSEEHPLDEKKSILKISTKDAAFETIASSTHKVGEKVVVAKDSSYLSDGTLFLSHIDHNLKVDVLIVGPNDVGLGEDDLENLLMEKEIGEDLFS